MKARGARSVALDPVLVRVLVPHKMLGTADDFHGWFLTQSLVTADKLGRLNARIQRMPEWRRLNCRNPWCDGVAIMHERSLEDALDKAL